MSEHLTTEHVELYHRRQLRPVELLEADAHLASCSTCRQLLSEKEGTRVSVGAFRSDLLADESAELEHPSHELFVAYADNQLDEVEREIFDSHLSLCAACADVMTDLRSFVAKSVSQPAVRRSVLPLEQQSVAQAPSLRERLLSFWHSLWESRSLQFAGAMAVLLLFAGVAAVVWYGTSGSKPESREVARVTQSPVPAESTQPAAVATPTPKPESGIEPDGANANADSPARETPERSPVRTDTKETTAQLALTDAGGRVTVDDKGNVSGLESLPPSEQQAIRRSVATGKAETPSTLATLIGGAGVLRGGSSTGVSFPVLSPVGTAVLADRPVLRWGQLSGATGYIVSIYDRNFNQVAKSQQQTATEWTVTRPLERGRIYSWHVTAIKEGREVTTPEPPAPEAKFLVLDEAKAAELDRARQSYKDSHLTLGTLYARAGLLDEAEREFQALVRDNPKSTLARKLLKSVQALRKR